MSGAVSFVLGLLGLGTAAGIDLGQSVSQKRKEAEMARECGWDAKGERAKMYERVRKEWSSIPDGHPIALKNGGSTIHAIRGLPIEQSIGSKIIWTQRGFLMTI